jgi:hypothetical protein
MAYFKIVLKGGHMGAGKSYDMVRYYRARDMLSAFSSAQSLSRAKKNPNATAVYSIEPVAAEEYRRGKRQERKDPYLTYRRRNSRKVCTYQK